MSPSPQSHASSPRSASASAAPSSPPHAYSADVPTFRLFPTHSYASALHAHCASQPPPDTALTFTFPSHASAAPFAIHQSRLTFSRRSALHALATAPFREARTRTVALPEDSPAVFAHIRAFLYCLPIEFAGVQLEELLELAQAAHRWQLHPLFSAVCLYLADADALRNAPSVAAAAHVAALPELPPAFQHYFWDKVARLFDGFGVDDVSVVEETRDANMQTDDEPAEGESPDSVPDADPLLAHPLCPKFPTLWHLALSHGVTHALLPSILVRSSRIKPQQLLDITLYHLEPHMKSDEHVLTMLQYLAPPSLLRRTLLGLDTTKVTSRATQLLARAILVPIAPQAAMQQTFPVSLQTIAPTRRVFLHGDVTPASRQDRMSSATFGYASYAAAAGAVWRTAPFEPTAAVAIAVEVVPEPRKFAVLRVVWTVGPCVDRREREIEVGVELRAGHCDCDIEGDRFLCRFEYRRRLTEKHATFQERIGQEVLDRFESMHTEGKSCLAVVAVDVSLVEPLVGTV